MTNATATKHPIPDAALDEDIAILGRKGGGKSYTAKGIVERLLDMGRRVLVLDPLGVWAGLRTSADGEAPGYPVAIFGGLHGDLPLDPAAAEPLARIIAAENLPAVVDLSELSKSAQQAFLLKFLHELRRTNHDALTIVLEEADVFAPQNPQGDDSKALHGEIDWIARRGRFKGFRLLTITQRPARLSKDVLTQANTLIIHRLPAPQDRDAAKAWVDGNGDRDQAKVVFDTLASLKVGEAWVLAQEPAMLERANFPRIKTLDTSATPKAGEKRIEPKTLAQVDVSAIRAALQAVQVEEKPTGGAATNKASAAAAEERGYQRGLEEGIKRGERAGIALGIMRARQALDRIDGLDAAPVASPLTTRPPETTPVKASIARQPAQPRAVGASLSSGEQKLLEAVSSAVAVSWPAAAIRAGYAPSGGGFLRARKGLLESGTVTEANNLVVSPRNDTPTPSADELVDLWSVKLDGGAGRVLRIIAAAPWSEGRTVSEIAAAADYVASGGGFLRAMKALRNSGIVERDGERYRLSVAFKAAAGRK